MISLAGRDILHSWGKFVFTGMGLGLLIGVTLTMAGVYRGMVDDAKVLQLHWTHVAEDDDSAWGQAGAHFHHLLSVYAGWLNAAAAGGTPLQFMAILPGTGPLIAGGAASWRVMVWV